MNQDLLLLLLVILSEAKDLRHSRNKTYAGVPEILRRSAPQDGIREIESPAGPGSAQPFLSTAPDGSVLLSWLERAAPESATYRLKFARRSKGAWSPSRVIAQRDDFFVNWADFPSVVASSGNILFAHWLQKSGQDTYAYDVRIASSRDGGRTWRAAVTPHRDRTKTEHGFVSLVARGDSVAAVWLDGRKMTAGHGDHEGTGEMTLRYGTVNAAGRVTSETELDERVCECCQTGMTWTAAGPLVVYRDRSAEEIRDNYFVRRSASGWTKPSPVHDDGWTIEGCPVNGPRIDSRGANVAVAWFTVAKGKNRVNVAFSTTSAEAFSKPIAVDTGHPLGRVDIVLLPDGSALVSWIEQVGGGAEVRVRRVWPEGRLDPALKVATSSPARSAGVPRMTLAGEEVYIAWTEPTQPSTIRISMLSLK